MYLIKKLYRPEDDHSSCTYIERKYFLFEDIVMMILTRSTKNIWVTFNAFRGPLKQKNNRKNSIKSIPSHSFSSIPLYSMAPCLTSNCYGRDLLTLVFSARVFFSILNAFFFQKKTTYCSNVKDCNIIVVGAQR